MGNNNIDHFSVFEKIIFKCSRDFMSDKRYAQWSMKRWFGDFDVENPNTFNEKIQWLKLYNRKDLYTQLVDKYSVREYVASTLDEKYLSELIGVWDRAEQINFDELPDSFVLKTTQASGTNIIVNEKSKLNIDDTLKKLNNWLEVNYYKVGREWAYKNVKPRIICEELLSDQEGNIPTDFKFFCFNGRPAYIQLDLDRFGSHERVFYDTQWNHQSFGLYYPKSNKTVPKPDNLDEMIELAKKLSKDIPFCRVDFYTLPKIVFGEITFYPGNGIEAFHPAEWDLRFGGLLDLPKAD